VSLDIVFLSNLIREHPLGVVLTILTLAAGLGGFLIPDTFMPSRVGVWMLTGSDISIDYSVEGVPHQITTAIITPPYREGGVPYAVVEILGGDTRIEDEGALVVTALTSLLDRNIIVVGDACLGYEADPEWSSTDVGMSRGELRFGVYLCKYGQEKLIGLGGGPPLEHFEVNLLSLEAAEGVEPPYNLTCRGLITHKLESGIDSIYGERRLTFWSIRVEEEKLMVTRFADLPQEELLVVNPWLKTLQDSRLLLTMTGFVAMVFLYRAARSSASVRRIRHNITK